MELPFDPDLVRIGCVDDIAVAAREVARCALEIGRFRVGPWDNIAATRPMTDANGAVLASAVFGWPEHERAWWRDRSLALRSPLPQISRIESEPVWANATGVYRVDGPVAIPRGINLELMNGIDVVRAAIVVPVHLPFSQIGVVSYSCIDDAREDLSAELKAHGPTLQLLSTLFIGSYVRATAERPHIAEDVALTARETQCLRWAAVGKTDSEIAELISRKHGTVRYHLNNCNEKLQTVTRAQAVSKATQLGYIGKI